MATKIPYNRELDFEYGRVDALTPLLRRVIANNPSAFTFHGTGTYIVGHGQVAIVDPGPDLAEHVDALLDAIRGETVSHILVTHTHTDHSPAVKAVQAATGAPTFAYGPHGTRPEDGASEGGADYDFAPDHVVGDGDVVTGKGWSVEAVHTPGHCSNHLCFALQEESTLLCGDHVMGWSTSIVSPPDGDMQAYMASLEKVGRHESARYFPTHGGPIDDPKPYVAALLAHRHEREDQILAELAAGPATIAEMVPRMYADVDPKLYPAAARSVLAHLIHMVETERVKADGDVFRLVNG
ncbi:MAG: MBL fold metallo-hydrolase [Rhodospirillaceae bacterium]|nr:MBL fold metallo-hydrolase [Rhodospirillaceae bacterium]MBT4773175.1 MBL fold metallo-hydrolase [Rhodospirillaceae bacterium]MBT5358355.1 MBL fold metallo-hydrolase [Rhodospirillaceae bacterium]MBT5771105.1 MBL fold metallo-hydrolase [Rhodospirillaceae bacterium]MBT6308718.1 MBL fold metallo-hydrolase [Rhodospirillaceae bacterium]